MRDDAAMASPFLYFAGERLTACELSAARLDGDVVDVGEAFMPADAVETRELRAASLRSLLGDHLAATRFTARSASRPRAMMSSGSRSRASRTCSGPASHTATS
jgi:hypothetical protein